MTKFEKLNTAVNYINSVYDLFDGISTIHFRRRSYPRNFKKSRQGSNGAIIETINLLVTLNTQPLYIIPTPNMFLFDQN